ncbi:MAG: response regulator [Nitrospira sp.]|nr:MAG: response regulator [Nitrospira sp.]
MATILFIDDDDSVRRLTQVALERAGYRVLIAESGQHGLRLLEHQEVDLILVDIFMPDMDGLEVIQLLRKSRPLSKIIATSGGSGDGNYLDTAKYLGAQDTLLKPFSLQELLDTVATQLRLRPRSI